MRVTQALFTLPLLIALGAACGGQELPGTKNEDATTEAQALSGSTCAAGVKDDYYVCYVINYSCYGGTCQYVGNCEAGRTEGLSACSSGFSTIYRLYHPRLGPQGENLHRETHNRYEGGTVEAKFRFSATAQPNGWPLVRCGATPYANGGDFISRRKDCEGTGRAPWSSAGYSYAPGTTGATPVYRCRVGGDHFLSRNAGCEGQIREGLIGYAR